MVNYIIITAARCAPENRQTALSHMPIFASDLMDKAGAVRCRYGVTMSGLVPGSLVFVQMYESLSGFEKAIDLMPKSKAYTDMINQAGADVYIRNIMKAMPISFTESAAEAKYLVLTRATPQKACHPTNLQVRCKKPPLSLLIAALTMRLGRIMTGSNPGDYMLGVSYPSLATVEAT